MACYWPSRNAFAPRAPETSASRTAVARRPTTESLANKTWRIEFNSRFVFGGRTITAASAEGTEDAPRYRLMCFRTAIAPSNGGFTTCPIGGIPGLARRDRRASNGSGPESNRYRRYGEDDLSQHRACHPLNRDAHRSEHSSVMRMALGSSYIEPRGAWLAFRSTTKSGTAKADRCSRIGTTNAGSPGRRRLML